ncbi:MAG TPA: tRNA (adenosine(37)-N6)-dimethylallyltransferase MiaA [Candidatus Limnocylindria bacterium]|nr:tRNA (adenosine(37)-N6)-dimethylallyltransferase MiaA [Candidatus Limnocylindria bacterium]
MLSPAAHRQPASPPLAAIIGPTAAGKTDLSLALAQRLPVEILVADSRQVYRGMDVGTAKPDRAVRAAVPHHLLDLVDPDTPFSLADWLQRARRLVPQIWSRGRLPLVVGGTGLYVSALVDGYRLGAQPPSPDLRRELAAEAEQVGLAPLAARLTELDPATAARTDLRNPRRVLRALEVAILAGGAAGEPAAEPWPGRLALIGIERPRPVLDARIERRAAAMFAGDLLDEAARLRAAGYGPDLPPLTGHGYGEAYRVLAEEWSVEQAVAQTVRRTRQYARRQLTWFRRDRRVVWLPAGEGSSTDLADQATDLVRRLTA